MLRLRKKVKVARLAAPKTVVEQVQALATQARNEEEGHNRNLDSLNETVARVTVQRDQTGRIANGLDAVLAGEQ